MEKGRSQSMRFRKENQATRKKEWRNLQKGERFHMGGGERVIKVA